MRIFFGFPVENGSSLFHGVRYVTKNLSGYAPPNPDRFFKHSGTMEVEHSKRGVPAGHIITRLNTPKLGSVYSIPLRKNPAKSSFSVPVENKPI
jgi:hypothetical protein